MTVDMKEGKVGDLLGADGEWYLIIKIDHDMEVLELFALTWDSGPAMITTLNYYKQPEQFSTLMTGLGAMIKEATTS